MKIDQLIRSRRKTIALIVEQDGRLVVRAPLRASLRRILEVVEQKSGWIKVKQKQAKAANPARQFVNGESFWYLGKTYKLEIVRKAASPLQLDGRFYLAQARQPKAAAVFTGWYKEQARQVIPERVRWYAEKIGFTYQQVKITSARRRWGSCSPRGTLCFTWRLVMAPLPVIDYVVAHELAHLLEKSHSRRFWAQVQTILPDYKACRDWLKVNGSMLSLLL